MDNLSGGGVEVIRTLESRVFTIGERTSVLVSNGASRNWFPKLVPGHVSGHISKTYFVRKMGRFSGQMHSAAQLVRIKTFSGGHTVRCGNLSVKWRGFTDNWIISCHWTVYRTRCIIYQRRSADNGNNESISYWVKPSTLRICPLEDRKS